MAEMRTKMVLGRIEKFTYGETLHFNAVATNSYPEDGSDEDNTYAKFSPTASLSIHVANPALLGQFEVGEKYYVDFTKA